MFGYVITNIKTLSEAEQQRFRALYCGMCHTLKQRYGNIGRLTLSYDMTFVALVLTSLYEPEESGGMERCMPHPAKPHAYILNPVMEYAADLNLMLAWHKCMDNWQDDHNPTFLLAKNMLGKAYRLASERWPTKAKAIETWMDGIRAIEQRDVGEIDAPINLTGQMLGELFCYRDDYWSDDLRRMGSALGRFIYLMDAYDDLPKDVRRANFNPLKPMREVPDFEDFCKQALTMMMADCADAFERLPVVQDADLIRNILYSGVWAKYLYIQEHKAKRSAKGEEARS